MSEQREMTLKEWMAKLPSSHRANLELAELEAKVERLESALETLADATNSIILEPLHKIAKRALEGKQE